MRVALIGDGESPHLLKWARALAPRVELWVASSRGFLPEFDVFLPATRRLALATRPRFAGGNVALLLKLPMLVAWLRRVKPDWLVPHYLSSHGTLAWLAVVLGRVDVPLAASAWGSDILVAPERSRSMRWLTRRVLQASLLTTSDSRHMAERMQALGAREVMSFPFGLEQLPSPPGAKALHCFFTNRALEPIYQPLRVLEVFASLRQGWPEARLVVANDGSMRQTLEARAARPDLAGSVQFLGRLDSLAQRAEYDRACWYLSLPTSDSVSVSVLEAMAYGAIPILSDLPANRELVVDGEGGLILADGELPGRERLEPLALRADAIARAGHDWIARHALFPNAVVAYLQRLQVLDEARRQRSAH